MGTITDSVGIAVFGDNGILQGVGNLLLHSEQRDNSWTNTAYDFGLEDKIHGIIPTRDDHDGTWRIFLYGGRYLALCELGRDAHSLELVAKAKINHFISSGFVDSLRGTDRFTLVTTYNTLVEMTRDGEGFAVSRSCHCAERTTLYCSMVRNVGDYWTGLEVFSGTALSEVIMWKSVKDSSQKSPILYRFSSPWGVIFSITCNTNCQTLVTTSDDRSARFWALKWDGDRPVGHTLQMTVFGHTARVFKSAFIKHGDQELLLTVGEDSRISAWDMDGQLVFRKECHLGGTIWNVVHSKGIIYLATSSGRLETLSLEECMERSPVQEIRTNTFTSVSYPSKIRIIAENQLVCLTNTHLLQLFERQEVDSWKCLHQVELPFKSLVLETKDNRIGVSGFNMAQLYEWNGSKLQLIVEFKEVVHGLIRSFHFLDDKFLLVNDKGDCFLFDSDFKRRTGVLPPCKENWSTSAFFLNGHLLVANRIGNLMAFNANENELTLTCCLKRVHGHLGITRMHMKRSNDFITCGHDGTVKQLRLDEHGAMEIIRTMKVPINWIERVYGEYYVGFNDNSFTVWTPERNHIFTVDCSGGHRCWDMLPAGNGAQFVYIRNKKLFRVSFPLESKFNRIPQYHRWHTNSANCLKQFSVDGALYIVSGGEDNMLKIHRLKEGRWYFVDEISVHISNIRTISIVKRSPNEWLLFSAGGRAQLCINRLQFDGDKLTIEECINFMLKRSDVQRNRTGDHNRRIDFDPETRLMCLVVDVNDIFVGCSDGFIRQYQYDLHAKEVQVVGVKYYGRCILQMHSMYVNGRRILLSMATDGIINFIWIPSIIDETTEVAFTVKHHESGINSFDLFHNEEDNDYWVVTGGDDERIAATRLRIEPSFQALSTREWLGSHTAQVTGIAIKNSREFYSASVDQTILLHNLDVHDDKKAPRSRAFTSVADVKGLVQTGVPHQLIVYGAGIDLIDLKCK